MEVSATEEKLNQLYLIVEQLVRMVGNNNALLEEMRTDMRELRQDVDLLKQDVIVLKQDVAMLKQDVAELKQDVAELKQDVAELKQDVAVLKQDVIVLKQDGAELRVGIKTTNERLARIEEAQKIQGESVNIVILRQANLEAELNLLKKAE